MTGIAIIGQGYMGRTHADSWAALGLGEQIKYICTPRPRDPFESAPKARFATELSEVLDDPEINIVSVCTPTPTHREIAVAALNAGKHVLLEKPIALTIDDALAIQQAAEASGTVLMVAQVIRFFGGYIHLREDVASGAIGSVLTARGTRVSNKPDWATWWHDEKQSGGLVVDFSIHDFDQMNLFLGNPRAVRAVANDAMGPVEVTIEYHGGGIGQVLGFTDAAQGVPFSSSIDLYGTEGDAGHVFAAAAPTEAGADGGANRFSRWNANDMATVEFPGDDPYTAQAKYFLDCVEAGSTPGLSSTGSAIRALEVALAARQSLAEGGARIEITSVVDDASAQGTVLNA